MALKPWYDVVKPREDLRDGKPLELAEFAVHLDKVRDGSAPSVYTNPVEFFDRTFMTYNLQGMAAEVVRRWSGEVNEASAVYNLTTQFGGGKTHALTLLYHLARGGAEAAGWNGVRGVLERAGVPNYPPAAVAVFVGQQFDATSGRGGQAGGPQRFTPWGEIAWQLGGQEAFAVVAEHDAQRIAPAGDVIRAMLPEGPCLILLDELMNFINMNRRSGLSGQFHSFLQNLTEEVRGRYGSVLAISLPGSEMTEMVAEDERDYQALSKLVARVANPVLISAEHETSEIIRRRLFDWNGLDRDATAAVKDYARWAAEHSSQLSEPMGEAQAFAAFQAAYPFHPAVLSVFERKWQTLPAFQRTRGVLQLLAQWVSRAYEDGMRKVRSDVLIDLGSAPLDESTFRSAVFAQLGEGKLEGAVVSDIAGSGQSFAVLLDKEAQDVIRKGRLHRKAATAVFSESNGGQKSGKATLPEVRWAVGAPGIDLGNVETVLDTLAQQCHYLTVEGGSYRFSIRPNLIKLHTDRRAMVSSDRVMERLRQEVGHAFSWQRAQQELKGARVRVVLFPSTNADVPDQPELTLVVLSPQSAFSDPQTRLMIEGVMQSAGASVRRFKNALVWSVADDAPPLTDAARRVLAWEDIEAEADSGSSLLDQNQIQQLHEHMHKAKSDLREAVWRAYRHGYMLNAAGEIEPFGLGLVHSSAAPTLINLIVNKMIAEDKASASVSFSFLLRNWPAQPEWGTSSVQQAFFASPRLPRLLNPDSIRQTIVTGVDTGELAYASRAQDDYHAVFCFKQSLHADQIEISDEMCILRKADAEAYLARREAVHTPEPGGITDEPDGDGPVVTADPWITDEPGEPGTPDDPATSTWGAPPAATHLHWRGDVPPQKWTMFYQRVLSRFAAGSGLRLSIEFSTEDASGISAQKIEETRQALKDLGLDGRVETE